MKLASFDDGRIGVVVDPEHLVDVSALLPVAVGSWPPVGMVRTIASFPELRGEIERHLDKLPRQRLADVRLQTPVAWPNKLLAFPANYQAHIEEMNSRNRAN